MSDQTPRQRLDYAGAIERLRRRRGMTQEALAEASGISPSYLSEVERGHKRPSTDVMVKIAEALGMSPSELLAYVERIDLATNRRDRGLVPPGAIAKPNTRMPGWLLRINEVVARAEDRPTAPEHASGVELFAIHDQEPVMARLQSPPDEIDPALWDAELESRDHALGILMALANRLEEEDLRVLISLAQRMGRGSG